VAERISGSDARAAFQRAFPTSRATSSSYQERVGRGLVRQERAGVPREQLSRQAARGHGTTREHRGREAPTSRLPQAVQRYVSRTQVTQGMRSAEHLDRLSDLRLALREFGGNDRVQVTITLPDGDTITLGGKGGVRISTLQRIIDGSRSFAEAIAAIADAVGGSPPAQRFPVDPAEYFADAQLDLDQWAA
jgi:hypothetical protein